MRKWCFTVPPPFTRLILLSSGHRAPQAAHSVQDAACAGLYAARLLRWGAAVAVRHTSLPWTPVADKMLSSTQTPLSAMTGGSGDANAVSRSKVNETSMLASSSSSAEHVLASSASAVVTSAATATASTASGEGDVTAVTVNTASEHFLEEDEWYEKIQSSN